MHWVGVFKITLESDTHELRHVMRQQILRHFAECNPDDWRFTRVPEENLPVVLPMAQPAPKGNECLVVARRDGKYVVDTGEETKEFETWPSVVQELTNKLAV